MRKTLDEALLKAELDQARRQPQQWDVFGNYEREVEIQASHGGEDSSLEERVRFLKDCISLVSAYREFFRSLAALGVPQMRVRAMMTLRSRHVYGSTCASRPYCK